MSSMRITLCALLAVALCACGQKPADAAKNTNGPTLTKGYTIVATTGMVADIVRSVAGDRAKVSTLIGEGVDPHLYKPTRDDVQTLLAADVVFYNGLLLEGKMGDTFVKVARSKKVFAVTELIDEKRLMEDGDHPDPHVWMDVALWSKAVTAVADALASVDPEGKATYSANAETYAAQLAKLDAYVMTVIGSIPKTQRVLVTAHDAFNYFGRAYDIEVLGIQGMSTESEASVDHVNKLVDLLVTRKISAVFVESSVSDKNVRALVEGAAKRGHTVTVGGELFSDAMGKPGTYEGSYVGMIDHNATLIARALGGKADAKGMQGKLSHKQE